MQMDIDELLELCAYYQINKHASALTFETILQDNNKPSPEKPKPEKATKKKLEYVEPKKQQKVEKVVRPKMQVVPRKEKIEQPPSTTIGKSEMRKKNEDLTYFISHLTGKAQDSKYRHFEEQFNHRDYENTSRIPGQYTTKNYDTFGRSNQNFQYETFQSKMQRQNTQISKFNFTQKPQQSKYFNLTQSKLVNTDPKKSISPFEPYQPSRTKKFWENTVYDTRKNSKIDFGNLMYSPVKRENPSPNQSFIFSQLQDRSVSKSKSKQKRKNSERPFYNASQLAPKERENQIKPRRNEYEQSVLSNSFISNDELRTTNNKKQFDDQGRRQTSTTNYNPKNIKQTKMNVKRDAFENDLDDGMEDIINHLASQQRNAPIAISLVSREVKL